MPSLKLLLRSAQAGLSLLLLIALFMPWAKGLGSTSNAFQLRERLEGPHKITAWIAPKGRIARDYQIADRVWMLAAAEGVVLLSALWPPLTAWPGIIVGAMVSGSALWAKHEISTFPFQRPGSGETVTLWAGIFLALISLLRWRTNR